MITAKEILCQENVNIDKGFFPEEMCLEDTLFFDIETTGLSPGNSRVFLIGIITKDREDPFLFSFSFLAEENTENEEKALLKAFSAFTQKKKYLVHFNGSSFDVPYSESSLPLSGIGTVVFLPYPDRSLQRIDKVSRILLSDAGSQTKNLTKI